MDTLSLFSESDLQFVFTIWCDLPACKDILLWGGLLSRSKTWGTIHWLYYLWNFLSLSTFYASWKLTHVRKQVTWIPFLHIARSHQLWRARLHHPSHTIFRQVSGKEKKGCHRSLPCPSLSMCICSCQDHSKGSLFTLHSQWEHRSWASIQF